MNLREDAKYCRQACRFKDYRERQKQVRSLHADGISIKEIAERLGSEIKTVKRWIKQ
jgi:transposase